MLYYGLVCSAINEDPQALREGMRLLATIAHKYNMPITWAITADLAQLLSNDLTEWHNEYSDEPLLMLDITSTWKQGWYSITEQSTSDDEVDHENINTLYESASANSIAEHLVKMREAVPNFISSEWKKFQKPFDWTVPNIAGSEWKNHVLVQALEQEGFRGLWGYRWEERDSIAEGDRGCPFGFFYPSTEQHNFSTPAAGSIAGIPHNTAAHLQKEEHNLRSSLINNILHQNINLYLENDSWNRWICYVEHVDVMDVVQLGQETLAKLDTYLEFISTKDTIKSLPLSDIIDDYWTNCQMTEPTYVIKPILSKSESQNTLTDDSDTDTESKKEFTYYDAECQCSFVEGTMEPVEMKNYITPPVLENVGIGVSDHSFLNYGVEYHLPRITNYQPIRKRSRLHINFTIESTKAMPYAVAVWGNHLGLQLTESNAKEVKWIDRHLLFIRLALEKGDNDFEITLSI